MARTNLTPQQSKLIEAYVRTGKLEEAALEAGYTESGKRKIYRTMRLKHVAEAYQKALDEAMTAREVLHRIGVHAREGEPVISMDALKTLAKHHKLLTDKVEASGPNGEPISVVFNLAPPASK